MSYILQISYRSTKLISRISCTRPISHISYMKLTRCTSGPPYAKRNERRQDYMSSCLELRRICGRIYTHVSVIHIYHIHGCVHVHRVYVFYSISSLTTRKTRASLNSMCVHVHTHVCDVHVQGVCPPRRLPFAGCQTRD